MSHAFRGGILACHYIQHSWNPGSRMNFLGLFFSIFGLKCSHWTLTWTPRTNLGMDERLDVFFAYFSKTPLWIKRTACLPYAHGDAACDRTNEAFGRYCQKTKFLVIWLWRGNSSRNHLQKSHFEQCGKVWSASFRVHFGAKMYTNVSSALIPDWRTHVHHTWSLLTQMYFLVLTVNFNLH